MPPPLVDSPKCPSCSLVGVCMPDETWHLRSRVDDDDRPSQLELFESRPKTPELPPAKATRLLVAPHVDLRPLYLNSPGLRVGKSGGLLRIKERDKVVQDARINEICQVNLMGAVQISTQAVQELCRAEKPICYFSHGGWFYGVTTGLNTKNVFLRRTQFRLVDEAWFCLRLAKKLVAGKIRNQRTMLLRNHVEPPESGLRELKSLDELLGFEGLAARIYFGLFAGMVKCERDRNVGTEFTFDFTARNRRPPRDPVNALLSLGYSLLAKDLTVACNAVGFDPMVGFYHQPRHGRPSRFIDGQRSEGLLPGLRVSNGDACNPSLLRLSCQLSTSARDPGATAGQDAAGRTGSKGGSVGPGYPRPRSRGPIEGTPRLG